MTITREQVADLQPGDVVQLGREDRPDIKARGEVQDLSGRLYVGPFLVRWEDGQVPAGVRNFTLTVVARETGQVVP